MRSNLQIYNRSIPCVHELDFDRGFGADRRKNMPPCKNHSLFLQIVYSVYLLRTFGMICVGRIANSVVSGTMVWL